MRFRSLDQRQLTQEELDFLDSHQVPFFDQTQLDPFLEYNDAILASCGIDLRPYAHYKHKFLSELDLFGAMCTTPIIAITGSVGKTTLTHLLSTLLIAAGKKVFTGGNIGVGLLDSIWHANQADYVVLEVSSFQLERCTSFAPYLAICSNIHENHLDRHGTLHEYVQAKLNLIAHQHDGHALLPFSLQESVSKKNQQKPTFHFFSLDTQKTSSEFSHYFLHNLILYKNYRTQPESIIDLSDISLNLYVENVVILAACLDILKIKLDNFLHILEQTTIPEHRLEKVATINTVDFYNDSKATIPASTLAALQKIHNKPVILFLGGISKGVDRSTLVSALASKVRYVFCFGKEAAQLKTWCDRYNISATAHLNLEEAFEQLLDIMQTDDQVLFSPAGASYDLYKDYKERGNHFKCLVNNLKTKNVF